MTGRRAIVGLSLLCALVFCAFMAPSAAALQGTTAYVCEPVEMAAAFGDEHCTEEAEGGEGFVHELIEPKQVLNAAATNVGTEFEPNISKLKTTIAGTEVELQAEGFKTCKEAWLENSEREGKMYFHGEYCGEFTKVVVTKPAGKCSVAGKAITLNVGVYEGGVLKNIKNEEIMWIDFIPSGGGLVFATFELVDAACPFKNMKFKATGVVDANVKVAGQPHDGSTLTFTTAETEKGLSVGTEKAAFEGTFTTYSPEGEEPALTATTTEK